MVGPQQACRAMRVARRGRFGRFGCCHGSPPEYPGTWLAAGPGESRRAGGRGSLGACSGYWRAVTVTLMSRYRQPATWPAMRSSAVDPAGQLDGSGGGVLTGSRHGRTAWPAAEPADGRRCRDGCGRAGVFVPGQRLDRGVDPVTAGAAGFRVLLRAVGGADGAAVLHHGGQRIVPCRECPAAAGCRWSRSSAPGRWRVLASWSG
jgi:hypothetical protein